MEFEKKSIRAKNFRRLRVSFNITQVTLAKNIAKTTTTIRNYETCRTEITADALQFLHDAGADIREIFTTT